MTRGAVAARTATSGRPDPVDERDDLIKSGSWAQGLLQPRALGLIQQGQPGEPHFELRRFHSRFPQ